MTNELWLPVFGYEGLYEVSDYGRVKSLARVVPHARWGEQRIFERLLKPGRDKDGYLQVGLYKEGQKKKCQVHRLVLEAFVEPCPEGEECRHLNGVRDDNRLENLAWGTPKENKADQVLHGTKAKGERHGSAKLTETDVVQIHNLIALGLTQTKIAKQFGVDQTLISLIHHGKNWTHLHPELGGIAQ